MTFYPHVGRVRIEGPYDAKGADDTPSRRKIFVCQPTSAEGRGVVRAADRDDPGEARVPAPADAAGRRHADGVLPRGPERRRNFDAGIERALRRLLADPEFVYRRETEPANLAPGKTYRVSDLALASRLSFFLWSSIPDDELMTLATQGKLKDPAVLEQQVRRMLADPQVGIADRELHRASG